MNAVGGGPQRSCGVSVAGAEQHRQQEVIHQRGEVGVLGELFFHFIVSGLPHKAGEAAKAFLCPIRDFRGAIQHGKALRPLFKGGVGQEEALLVVRIGGDHRRGTAVEALIGVSPIPRGRGQTVKPQIGLPSEHLHGIPADGECGIPFRGVRGTVTELTAGVPKHLCRGGTGKGQIGQAGIQAVDRLRAPSQIHGEAVAVLGKLQGNFRLFLAIGEGGTAMTLTGIADRVDGWVHEDKLYLRVVDYKTGKKEFSLSDVWHGMNLQMLLYLFTLEKWGEQRYGKQVVPAGVLYVPAFHKHIAEQNDLSDEEIAAKQRKKPWKQGRTMSSCLLR